MVWSFYEKIGRQLGKEVYGLEVAGVKPKGRPKKTWLEVVLNDVKGLGLKKNDALNQDRWRAVINNDRPFFS